MKRKIQDYSMITVSSVIYAVGISLFLDPNNLAPGGVTGIAIIINRLCGLPTGTLILLLNVPLLCIGIWKFGWRFLLSTSYAILLISLVTDLIAPIGAVTRDPLLASVIGGALSAVALGLIFRAGATTGGIDIVVRLLRIRYPHLRTSTLFLLTDLLIAGCSGFVFGDMDVVLYAVIAIFIMSFVMDMVLYGMDEAKLLYIISDRPEDIAERLLREIDIGVTYL